jgi:isoleucyl-tRNA synthetase
MNFHKGTRRPPIEYEKDIASYWREQKTFEKSVQQRPSSNAYIFYDGPPFITGVPHYGTLLSSVVKDAVTRYFTMKGKHIERVWGWDCHGLPAEVYTERKLGIKDRRDIGTKISLEDYINACRENMIQTGSLWEDAINRIGRWVDFKGAYRTMDKEYMESIWWAFKKLFEAGKIYEGEKVLLYCPRDATPIAKAEVAMDNSYQDDTDPSVYVKFKLTDSDAYLLAWTTTPWTLNSNTAIAVNKAFDYVEVEVNGERLILAKNLLEKVMLDQQKNVVSYTIRRTFKGDELVGKTYEPLFENRGENGHKIWHADFVLAEEGTGIAHESPAYGEDDYELAKANGIPIVLDTDEEGYFTSGEWKGRNVWEANQDIAESLQERGVVWRIEYITHSYPHCHRCNAKLIYRAHPSWFLDIASQRQLMLELNDGINWFPEHIKHGRFEDTIESAPDWNISRDRFWATAMPVWKGKDGQNNEHVKVVGSYQELKELSGVELEDYHRPWIDDVTFTIDGIEYHRVDKVMDGWFESGSMPFAQFHYPFENVEKFEQNFPGDFIAEYVGQVRAWFYYVHAVSVGIFGERAFNNVIVTGTISGNDGRKMSKSYGNFTDPSVLIDLYSADSLRFLLLSSPLLNGEDFALQDKEVADVNRKLNMIWNMYDFFTLYADVDGWNWDGSLDDPTPGLINALDIWIVSRVHQLSKSVDRHMQLYDVQSALKPVLEFVDDASNWYVRRSRKRFWKSQNDDDKKSAYRTLHYILTQLATILAPFTPFLSEELYRKLTGGESVHLLDWPDGGHVNEILIDEMASIRQLIAEGLKERASTGIKVRQPLSQANLILQFDITESDRRELLRIIKEELNVHEVVSAVGERPSISINTELTPELRREGLMREVVRQVQNARKQANLNVDNRIELELKSESTEVNEAVKQFTDTIKQETLATSLNDQAIDGFETIVKVEGSPLTIRLKQT